jgi:hypothetical protein
MNILNKTNERQKSDEHQPCNNCTKEIGVACASCKLKRPRQKPRYCRGCGDMVIGKHKCNLKQNES